jgi:hypothetical protein
MMQTLIRCVSTVALRLEAVVTVELCMARCCVQHGQDVIFREATRLLAPHGNVVFVREPSPQAASHFPDGMLDFVYVDARHDYTSVSAAHCCACASLHRSDVV